MRNTHVKECIDRMMKPTAVLKRAIAQLESLDAAHEAAHKLHHYLNGTEGQVHAAIEADRAKANADMRAALDYMYPCSDYNVK